MRLNVPGCQPGVFYATRRRGIPATSANDVRAIAKHGGDMTAAPAKLGYAFPV